MLPDDYSYIPESADDFFAALMAAMRLVPDYVRVYGTFDRVFRQCIDQSTESVGACLCGAFAKTDYLLKEHGADAMLAREVNGTRARLRKRGGMTREELGIYCAKDLRSLCRFIAIIYGADIPPQLVAMFPEERMAERHRELVGDSVRMIVTRLDGDYVYGHAEDWHDGENVRVCYTRNKVYDFDWTYLADLIGEGTQLNLVRPRMEDGVLYPELIIVEPDYLVDISAVARCFTNYAESPLVNLLNRLQPQQGSEAIVMGNFAGQMLDEAVKQPKAYADSVKDFFAANAVNLLTAGVGPNFHDEARRQRQNIANAMGRDLPAAVTRFNSREGMVEPSFFSEMLGLQGRMDYLQLDFRVLLEQKSGKGDFPCGDFSVPRYKEEHYVQLLLYMLLIRYNYRGIYEQNNRELHAFLLYSKYRSSLLGLGFAPELVFRAMKLRNGLAAQELRMAQEGAYKQVLGALTPEAMNLKNVTNALWKRYQYSQIAELLAPIHAASELEREYYYRFLTFISNEHLLSKLGNKTKESSGFAATWHDSLEVKRQAGNIYDNLTLVSPDGDSKGMIERVRLEFSENVDNDMANFRVGDIVILYPYAPGSEPDARRTMVFRCTIEDIQTDTVTLVLRAAQSDGRVFLWYSGMKWAMEHDFMEASYSSLYRGMHSFLSAPKRRRDIILLQRRAEVDVTRELKGDYGTFNELALRVKRAKDLFLIIGPPGTGKTSFGMLNTVKEELLERDSSVLLLSYTNRAVDEICSKLHKEGIDFIRVGSTLNCAAEYRGYLLAERARRCANLAELRTMLETARVYVGTTTAFTSNIALLKIRQFSLAVIDEASQILEPHLIGLLSACEGEVPAIRKIVMIGDHKQLPAVVQQTQAQSAVRETVLRDILLTDCRLSLFERLLKRYRDDEQVTYMLCRQGRMHHDIARFPNELFYNNKLAEVPLPHQIADLPHSKPEGEGIENVLLTRRFAFVATPPPEDGTPDKVNPVEADLIAATVRKIYEIEGKDFDVAETVGVIVPYRNQIATIRNAIDTFGIPELHRITIDTVERYQGSQRKFIIYGFTISKYYQLKFLADNVFVDYDGSVIDRKLNVAMTRAEEHLVIFGNPSLLARNHIFSRLMAFAKEHESYYDAAGWR